MAHEQLYPTRRLIPLLAVAVSGLCHASDRILLEAEAAAQVEAPAIIVKADAPPEGIQAVEGASGGAYLAIPQGVGNPPEVITGKAVYPIKVPADGNYTLWLRAWWDDSCGNSVTIQINDSAPFPMEDTTYKIWHWVRSPPRLPQLKLQAGEAVLVIHNREDGIRIDQILLTTNRRYIPVEIENADEP